jgi:hypothetical protein
MAIKIGLVVGTGSVTIQHGTGDVKNYASYNLKYEVSGTDVAFFQLQPNLYLGTEPIATLEDAAGVLIGNEAAVRAYLDAFVGAMKAL